MYFDAKFISHYFQDQTSRSKSVQGQTCILMPNSFLIIFKVKSQSHIVTVLSQTFNIMM